MEVPQTSSPIRGEEARGEEARGASIHYISGGPALNMVMNSPLVVVCNKVQAIVSHAEPCGI